MKENKSKKLPSLNVLICRYDEREVSKSVSRKTVNTATIRRHVMHRSKKNEGGAVTSATTNIPLILFEDTLKKIPHSSDPGLQGMAKNPNGSQSPTSAQCWKPLRRFYT